MSADNATYLPHLTCLQIAEQLQAIAARHGDLPVRMIVDKNDDHATVVEGPAMLYDDKGHPIHVVWLMSGNAIFSIQG